MSPKSNIYVSVTRARDPKGDSYHRPLHTWMISVEQHTGTLHMPGKSNKDPEPIHFAAAKNEETGVYTVNTHSSESEPAIIGNILIAEDTNTSVDAIHQLLEKEFGQSSDRTLRPHKSGGSDDPEHWIRTAVHVLQGQKLVEHFNLDEFMTFAHGYEANRMEGEAHALVAYPKVHKEHEKKASKHKFWVSHPMSNRTKVNGRGEASVYGGLM